MRTVTFNTQVHDGVIEVPDKYKNLETRNIEVILIVKNPDADDGTKGASKTSRNAKGILRKYKNPALIPKEKTAWEMAVKEKHAHR
jgi:hypothetical protein